MLQDKQDIKENHNSFLIINSCKRETYCAANLYNNSIYEEDKAIIHKMNQQMLCLLSIWKRQDMDNSNKIISFAFDL